MAKKRILLVDDDNYDVDEMIEALENDTTFSASFTFVKDHGKNIVFPIDIDINRKRMTCDDQKDIIVNQVIRRIDDFDILLLDMQLIDKKRENPHTLTSFSVIEDLIQKCDTIKFESKKVVLITGYSARRDKIEDFLQRYRNRGYMARVKYEINHPTEILLGCENDRMRCTKLDKKSCSQLDCFVYFLIDNCLT